MKHAIPWTWALKLLSYFSEYKILIHLQSGPIQSPRAMNQSTRVHKYIYMELRVVQKLWDKTNVTSQAK